MDTVLVLNAGSSSLKFQVFASGPARSLKSMLKGEFDGVGGSPHLRVASADGPLVDQSYPANDVPDVSAATRIAGAWLSETQGLGLTAVGHRVVHGGPDYVRPVRVDEKVLRDLERYIALAPLHQPGNLAPIRSFLERHPELPQVACFDTAFHRSHHALADRYAIPESFYREGVRKYGFHGLSYEYVAARLKKVAPDVADGRVIVAHLGNGASLCAMSGGRSVESTMGFTALDGLPMGTRCGQIDPGVILYLLEEKGLTGKELEDLLYRDCGLKGLSGVSSDFRELQESTEPGAAFAIDYFAYRVGLHAGMLAAALGGLDAFVFTAGIGENSTLARARIAERLGWLGAELDAGANAAARLVISTERSPVAVLVVPTDEEQMIARHTLEVITIATGGALTEPRR